MRRTEQNRRPKFSDGVIVFVKFSTKCFAYLPEPSPTAVPQGCAEQAASSPKGTPQPYALYAPFDVLARDAPPESGRPALHEAEDS